MRKLFAWGIPLVVAATSIQDTYRSTHHATVTSMVVSLGITGAFNLVVILGYLQHVGLVKLPRRKGQ